MTETRCVALLRGINIGKAKRIAMADLRALVEGLGYRDVQTLLNSGNVVFTATRTNDGPAARIEAAILAKLGVASRVTVLAADELATIVAGNPLLAVAKDPSRLMVAVLQDQQGVARLAPLQKQRWAPDVLAVGARAAYLWCAHGILESPLATALARALGDGVTSRNWSTVQKLHAMTQAPEPAAKPLRAAPAAKASKPAKTAKAGAKRKTRARPPAGGR